MLQFLLVVVLSIFTFLYKDIQTKEAAQIYSTKLFLRW